MIGIRFLLVSVWALVVVPTALADAAPDSTAADSVVVLPEVVVERDRALSEARSRRPTAFVTELEAGSAGRAVESLAEVLNAAAGVHVVQYGGLGSFSTVSLRGAPAGQVAVYMDGVPLNSAAHSVVNLSDLPVTAIERVEVYRGGSPLMLGAARPGGAVHLVTGARSPGGELRLARGSFDTWDARGTGGFRAGTLSGWAQAGYQGTAGDFTYPDDNGTPANLEDDGTSPRLNNRFDAGHALGRLGWRPFSRWEVALNAQATRNAKGFPGLGSTPALNAAHQSERALGRIEVARALGADGSLALDASLVRERSQFSDREGRLGLGRHDTDDRFGSEQFGATGVTPTLPFGTSLRANASVRDERAETHDDADGRPDPPQSERRTRGAALEARGAPVGGRLVVVAAQRWDRVEDHLRSPGIVGRVNVADVTRDLRSPQLGACLGLVLGLEARANWARADRVPDFMELFGNQGAVVGNPLLSPERTETRDFGLAWRARAHGWGAAAEWGRYASDAESLIVFVRFSQSSAKAQNVSRAEIRGDELSLRLDSPLGLSASGSFTWQSAVDRGAVTAWQGKNLPQRPARQLYARLDALVSRVRLGADVQHDGDTYLDRYNAYRVKSRTLLGASLGYAPWNGALTVTLEGKNLGNAQAADVTGYPLPGRSFFAAVAWRLGAAAPDL